MSPLHRSWLADQADAIKYQREMRELDTYANPNPANKAAAQDAGRKAPRAHQGGRMNTTLIAIREHDPCTNGWKKLLSHLEKTKADDELLPITTILDSNGVEDALWCLRAVGGRDREIRLYAVWCARQVQHLMADQRSINALDVAVRHANGTATDGELAAARDDALAAARDDARDAAWAAARGDAWATALATALATARGAALAAARDAEWGDAWDDAWASARDAASNVQAKELRRVCDCISAGQDPYPFKEAE